MAHQTDQQTMQLVLIRHGESEWNKLNLFTGWTDVELTDTGREEAAAGGRALKEAGFDIDRKRIDVKGVKEIGEYTATIHLHKEVTAEVPFSLSLIHISEPTRRS